MSSISNFIRKAHHSFCTAVVVAAGDSTRMGRDKLMLSIGAVPVLVRSLLALNASAAIDEIIVVTQREKLEAVAGLKAEYGIDKLTKIVIGGKNRTESALAGVSEADARAKIICIHDAVRPFVSEQIIADAVHYAVLYQAAAPAIPVKDTIKIAVDGVVTETPDRSQLFAVQTPQAFQADIIKAALSAAVSGGHSYTDDCAAAEALGVRSYLCRGSEDNIKITTPADLIAAEAILQKLEATAGEQ